MKLLVFTYRQNVDRVAVVLAAQTNADECRKQVNTQVSCWNFTDLLFPHNTRTHTPIRIKLISRFIIIHRTKLQNKIFCVVCMMYVPGNIAETKCRPTVEVEEFGSWHRLQAVWPWRLAKNKIRHSSCQNTAAHYPYIALVHSCCFFVWLSFFCTSFCRPYSSLPFFLIHAFCYILNSESFVAESVLIYTFLLKGTYRNLNGDED